MLPLRESVRQTPAYVPGEQPKTLDVIKLNTNESPYPPPAKIFAEIQPELEKARLYPDPLSTELRKAAANVFGVKANQILAGNGSDDILNIALRTFVNPGETVGFLDLTYSLYQTLAAVHGANIVHFPTDEQFELTEPINCPEAKLLFLASPNPPKGKQINRELLWQTCAQASGIVLIDEAYGDYSDEDHWDFLREFPNVIISRTLSKSYSLAGMRVGFAIAAPEIIVEMDKVRDSYNLDRIAQCLGKAALDAHADFVPLWQKIRRTRERLEKGLTQLGFKVCESEANFVFASPQWIEAAQLHQRLKAQHIFVRHFRQPRIENYLRITIGTDEEIDALLAAITAIKSEC